MYIDFIPLSKKDINFTYFFSKPRILNIKACKRLTVFYHATRYYILSVESDVIGSDDSTVEIILNMFSSVLRKFIKYVCFSLMATFL